MVEKPRKVLCAEGEGELQFAKDLVGLAERNRHVAWRLVLSVWADSREDKILQLAPTLIRRFNRKPKV